MARRKKRGRKRKRRRDYQREYQMSKRSEKQPVGAPKGSANGFVHGLTAIVHNRQEKRLPRGKDRRFKLELLNDLIRDAGGPEAITATKRLLADIIAADAVWFMKMERATQKILRLVPRYNDNPAALAKFDGYKRSIINSLSANLDRFGYERSEPPKRESMETIVADATPEEEQPTQEKRPGDRPQGKAASQAAAEVRAARGQEQGEAE
jgi:hypothetical protein